MRALSLRRLGGIIRRVRPLRVARHAALRDQRCVVVGAIPVAAPLPDVARHVVKAVTIRRKLRDWRDPGKTVFAGILYGEASLICVSHVFAAGPELITPDVELSAQSR